MQSPSGPGSGGLPPSVSAGGGLNAQLQSSQSGAGLGSGGGNHRKVRQSSDDGQGPKPDFFEKCFCIFDDYCTDENAPPEEIPIFFYPPTIDLDHKLFFLGSCLAIINFTRNFTSDEVQIIALERSKLAVKAIEGVESAYMVLGASLDEPDTTVSSHLQAVYSAFHFCNGPFSDLTERCKTRVELIREAEKIGKEMLPLINGLRSSTFSSFNPLPIVELPPNCNRYFLFASQILHNLVAELPNNIAGCIFYEGSVLCSHLDLSTTRWIRNKLDYRRSAFANQEKRLLSRNSSPALHSARSDPEADFVPVFISLLQLKSLREHSATLTPQEGSASGATASVLRGTISGDSSARKPSDVVIHESMLKPNDQGEYVGLLMLSLNSLSMAVVTEISALCDPRHVNKVRLCVDSKLVSLEKHLHKVFANKKAGLNNSGNRDRAAHPDGDRNGALPDTIPNYNFLVADSMQETLKSSNLVFREVDNRFLFTANHMHNLFNQNPEITQAWLKDQCGYMYCSKMFSKETYYQQFYLPDQERVMDRIEDDARRSLAEDFNIFLI